MNAERDDKEAEFGGVDAVGGIPEQGIEVAPEPHAAFDEAELATDWISNLVPRPDDRFADRQTRAQCPHHQVDCFGEKRDEGGKAALSQAADDHVWNRCSNQQAH